MGFDPSAKLENVNHPFSQLAPRSVHLMYSSPVQSVHGKTRKIKVPPMVKLTRLPSICPGSLTVKGQEYGVRVQVLSLTLLLPM